MKDQSIFRLVITLFTLITYSLMFMYGHCKEKIVFGPTWNLKG